MSKIELVTDIARELSRHIFGNRKYDEIAAKVADKIGTMGRLANVDEITAIAETVFFDNERPSSEMTYGGYKALPRYAKVNVDGVPHVIINGSAVKVSLRENPAPCRAADAIIDVMRTAYNASDKCGYLFDELFEADGYHCCPECGGCDCTMFYGEDDGDAWHCNECDIDFYVEHPAVIDTVEEIELIPEQDIVMVFDYDRAMKCFKFVIFKGDEPIYDATAGDYDAMMAFGSGFINAYDMMRPGIGIANVESGKRFDVDSMSGDCVTCKGMMASRSKMAAAIAGGTMMVVSDQIYANDVVAGDMWASMTHDVEVDIVDGDSVYWYENEREGKAISASDYYTDSIQGFLAHMDADGFDQV